MYRDAIVMGAEIAFLEALVFSDYTAAATALLWNIDTLSRVRRTLSGVKSTFLISPMQF